MIPIGLDVGNGHTKVCLFHNKTLKSLTFPTLVALSGNFSEDFLADEGTIPFIMEVGKKVYLLGETAVASRAGERSDDPERFITEQTPILSLAALGRLLIRSGLAKLKTETSLDVQLTTGLPIDFLTKHGKNLQDALTGSHKLTFHYSNGDVVATIQLNITVGKILPQGYGAYLDFALDEAGKKIPAHLITTAVIDGGQGTCDIAATGADGSYQRTNSRSLPSIMQPVYDDMIRTLAEEAETFLTRTQIEACIQNGQPFTARNQRTFDLAAMRTIALEANLDLLMGQIGVFLHPLQPQKIIVCGGSGAAMYPAISKHWPHAVLAPEPQLANARGYLKFGKRQIPSGT